MIDAMEKKKPSIYAFDFDGTIAEYHGFKAHDHELPPHEEVVKAIRILKERGNKIIIFSTRGEEFLEKYCEKYNIPFDYINENPELEGENRGKPIAKVYIDDRSLCYKGQFAEELVDEVVNFKAHWEK